MKKYVISSIIPGSTVNRDFFNVLSNYAKKNKAELLLLITRPNLLHEIDEIEDYLLPFIETGSRRINKSLKISDYRPNINQLDPLTGLDSIAAQEGNLIIGFPRHRFKMVPRMLKYSETPRAIWCTGTVSYRHYKESLGGKKVKNYHKFGALTVTVVDNEHFHIRQLEFDGTGMQDLDKYYTKDKVVKKDILGLSLGDDHSVHLNKNVVDTTKKIIKKLAPKHVFHHDTFDSTSISHHLEGKYITKAKIQLSLEEEAIITAGYLHEMSKISKAQHYLVASNHCEHLDRYLDEARYKHDYPNHTLALELAHQKASGKFAIEYLLNKYENLKHIKFLHRKDSVIIGGHECADHGDEGANGSRANTREKGITHSGKIITGHVHAPEIGVFGNYVNGTSTYLSLGYTKDSGSSSWLNSHTIIYENGARTHIHIMPDGGCEF